MTLAKSKTTQYQEAPGKRILRAGDKVKVSGLRGLWKIKDFTVGATVDVTIVGGPKGHFRTVTVDRIGTRKETAQ